MVVFKEVKQTKQIKKIIKSLGLEHYIYNGYNPDYDILHLTKALGDGNYLFASYNLAEINKVVMPSYGTRVDLLDAFMCNYLVKGDINKVLENATEEVKSIYGFKIPKDIKTKTSVKDTIEKEFVLLYTRDTSGHKSSLNKTIDLYFVKEHERFIVFKTIHFIQSIDFAKTGEGQKYIENEGNVIYVPKYILETQGETEKINQ